MVTRDSPVSIQLRLLAAALLILPLFLGLTAWSLDRAFASYQQDAQSERMRLLQLILARETEWDGEQWVVASLDEPRLGLLNSGLYALLLDPGGDVLWSSPSAEQIGDLAEPGRRVSEIASRLRLLDTALGERRLLACELQPYKVRRAQLISGVQRLKLPCHNALTRPNRTVSTILGSTNV